MPLFLLSKDFLLLSHFNFKFKKSSVTVEILSNSIPFLRFDLSGVAPQDLTTATLDRQTYCTSG